VRKEPDFSTRSSHIDEHIEKGWTHLKIHIRTRQSKNEFLMAVPQ